MSVGRPLLDGASSDSRIGARELFPAVGLSPAFGVKDFIKGELVAELGMFKLGKFALAVGVAGVDSTSRSVFESSPVSTCIWVETIGDELAARKSLLSGALLAELPNDIVGGGSPLVPDTFRDGTPSDFSLRFAPAMMGGAVIESDFEIAFGNGLGIIGPADGGALEAPPSSEFGLSGELSRPVAKDLGFDVERMGAAVSLPICWTMGESLDVAAAGSVGLSPFAAVFSTAASFVSPLVGLRVVTVCMTAKVPNPRNNPTAAKRPSIERFNRTRLGVSDSVMAVPGLG